MEKLTFNEWMKYCLWADVEAHCQFSSKDQKVQQNLECDFIAQLIYENKIYMYILCLEPHTENKYFILHRWDGTFYYRGDNIKELFTIVKKEFEELRKIMKEAK